MAHHLHRIAQLGKRVLINAGWYYVRMSDIAKPSANQQGYAWSEIGFSNGAHAVHPLLRQVDYRGSVRDRVMVVTHGVY